MVWDGYSHSWIRNIFTGRFVWGCDDDDNWFLVLLSTWLISFIKKNNFSFFIGTNESIFVAIYSVTYPLVSPCCFVFFVLLFFCEIISGMRHISMGAIVCNGLAWSLVSRLIVTVLLSLLIFNIFHFLNHLWIIWLNWSTLLIGWLNYFNDHFKCFIYIFNVFNLDHLVFMYHMQFQAAV